MREVDPARIAAVGVGERGAQPVGGGRRQHQMDVVGQQAPGEARYRVGRARLRHEIAIGGVVVLGEEHLLPPVPALGDVVRYAGDDDASEAGHDPVLDASVG